MADNLTGLGSLFDGIFGQGMSQDLLGNYQDVFSQSLYTNQVQSFVPYQQNYLAQQYFSTPFSTEQALEELYKLTIKECAGPFCKETESCVGYSNAGRWFCCSTCETWFDHFPDWKDLACVKSLLTGKESL